MEERRLCKREKLNIPLQYKDKYLSAKRDSFSKDFSLTGICFFSEKKLKSGKIIRLNLYNEPRIQLKTVKAQIIWVQEFQDNLGKGFFCGAKFVG